MINLVIGTLLAMGYLLIFWLLGAALPKRFTSSSVPVMCLTGFLLYYSLFQLVALPLKITQQPLKLLSVLWIGILGLLILFVLIRRRDILRDSLRGIYSSKATVGFIALLIIFALGIGLLLGFNTNSISDYDACYYIGLPVSSVYSNTLELMSPYTGTMMDSPHSFYLLNTDTLHSAVVYQVLNIHPLMERKWSFTIAMTVLFQMALYLGGKFFFKDDRGKTGLFVVLSDLVLFYSYSIAGVSHYFAYRTYEGKSVTSYFYMTLIFVFCVAIYQKKSSTWPWAALFLSTVSGIAFCNTAIFVVPFMIGITLLPYTLSQGVIHRNWLGLRNMIIVLIPAAFWLGIYLIM